MLRSFYDSRHKFGEILTTEATIRCDVVIAVLDSGVMVVLDYVAKAGVPFQHGKRSVVVDDSIMRGTTSSKITGLLSLVNVQGSPYWMAPKVASMFKIGHSKEFLAIPEHLSYDGKDFVRQCLQRNPSSRPSAVQLLEHRYKKRSTFGETHSKSKAFRCNIFSYKWRENTVVQL